MTEKNSIRAYKVSGTTVRRKLYADDEKERYFHIYYSESKRQAEREKFEDKIDQMGKKLKECMGLPIRPRGDKSYLGARSERVYSNESMDTKLFIEFVALIIRSKIYTCLKDAMDRQEHRKNFMTVPAALRELEKIEILKGADNEYRLDYAVTARQKEILNAFGFTASNVQKQAAAISSDLARIEVETFEKAANEQMKTQ